MLKTARCKDSVISIFDLMSPRCPWFPHKAGPRALPSPSAYSDGRGGQVPEGEEGHEVTSEVALVKAGCGRSFSCEVSGPGTVALAEGDGVLAQNRLPFMATRYCRDSVSWVLKPAASQPATCA